MSEYSGSQPWPTCDGIVDRRTFLPERARGARVLHLGCVDEHLTQERAGTGGLLHEELDRVTEALVGFDISEDGLDLMRGIVPGEYIHGDVESMEPAMFSDIDLVIAAEIIEHLGSPMSFYRNLRAILEKFSCQAILTTPNAYNWSAWVRTLSAGAEIVHPDHTHYYSPVTLDESLDRGGLKVLERYSHFWDRSTETGVKANALKAVDGALAKKRPWMGAGLVWVVEAA